MDKIWVDRLIVGAKTFKEVPESRKNKVKELLKDLLDNEEITKEEYDNIVNS